MKVGYVRVSTKEQNTARQDELMKVLGAEKVFTDKLSGKDTEREQLLNMMNYVREGDTVTVESISRFARNVKDLLDLIEQLTKKNVQFISQKENIDTTTTMGKFILTIFGAVAELERNSIRERQREGIDIAMAEGRMTGRPKKAEKTFGDMYISVKNGGLSASEGARKLGISRSTWYRKVKEYKDDDTIDF